jgi:hypothetical protein
MAKKSKSSVAQPAGARVVGDVVMVRLGDLQPNGWNPNVVPEHVMRSIEHGFTTDGWLKSQALLVWATDELGDTKNLIIDGEHRWRAAGAVGIVEGPAVLLHGLSEREAKALTVKMNQKRGAWDNDALGELLRGLGDGLESADFGFDAGEWGRLTEVPATDFLQSFIAIGESIDAAEQPASGAIEVEAPTVVDGDFVAFSIKLTKDQNETLLSALKRAKKTTGARTNAAAMIALADAFLAKS